MAFLFIDPSIICDNNFSNESGLVLPGKIPGNRRQIANESPLNSRFSNSVFDLQLRVQEGSAAV